MQHIPKSSVPAQYSRLSKNRKIRHIQKLGSRAFAEYRCMLLSYVSTIRIVVLNNLCICLRKVPDERLSGVTHLLIPNR